MRSALSLVFALAITAASCSDSAPPEKTSSASTSAAPASISTPTLEPGAVPVAAATTSTSVPPPTSTSSTAAPTLAPVPGGSTAGDPYFDGLGNSGYDALSYDLDLEIDPATDVLSATSIMTALATVSLSSFNLDFVGLDVSAVFVDGVEADFVHDAAELVVTAVEPISSGDIFSVAVDYSGVPDGVRSPAWRDLVGWLDAGEYTYVVSEPTGAHGWYPVNDHPIDKATYTITVTAPIGLEVIANGVLESTAVGESSTTWRYVARDPIASYLVTVAVGDFVIHEGIAPNGTLLRDAYRPSVEAKAKPDLDLHGEMLEVFSELFGPYPFEVYGGLVVDDNFGGALETQTLSVFSGGLFGGPFGEIVVAHELSHQWFGDSLTPATWRDIWLNEGFATYSEWLWAEVTDPTYDIDAVASGLTRAGRPIWSPPGDPGVAGLFDSTVYQRGALTLHALRRTVGDENFFDILRTYTSRYAYGNVTTADFIAVAEEVSAQDLGALFDAWLYEDETPELPDAD